MYLDGSSGGSEAASYVSWGPAARGTAAQEVCVTVPSSGTVNGIRAVVGGVSSNVIPFARHSGTTYWVTSSGSNSNSCLTQAAACATPEGAEGKSGFGPGDVILVRSGTYSGAGTQFSASHTGTSSSPITLRGYPGDLPRIHRTDNQGTSGQIVVDLNSFWQVAGLEIRATGSSSSSHEGVTLFQSAPDIRIANCYWSDSSESGIIGGADRHRISLFGNEINDMGELAGDGNWHGHGIYHGGGDDWVIAFNRIHGSAAYGIQMYRGQSTPSFSGGRVYSNEIYGNSLNDSRGGGMVIASNVAGVAVYNNLIHSNGNQGLKIANDAANVDIFNNTFYNNHNTELKVMNVSNSVVVKNNIFVHTSGGSGDKFIEEDTSGTNLDFDNNLYWDNGLMTNPWSCNGSSKSSLSAWRGCAFSPGSNDRVGDPDFASPGTDFRLTSGSPAIDAGTIPPVARLVDHEGSPAPVNSAHDTGAFEFFGSGSASGPEAPPPVTNLRRTDSQ